MKRAWPWWLAAAALASWIWWESSRALHLPDALPSYSDKIIHACVWATLAGLVAAGAVARGVRARVLIPVAIVLATAYGAVDEWHQSHVPGRDSSFSDLLADLTGAVVGASVVAGPGAAYARRRHGDRP